MQSIDKELDYLNQMVLKMTDLVEKNMKIAQDFYLTKKTPSEGINLFHTNTFTEFIP